MAAIPPHIAFLRASNAKKQRGVLNAADDSPLLLQGCSVNVETHWFYARVSVRTEYRNQHPEAVHTFAAIAVEPGWMATQCRIEIDEHSLVSRYDACLLEEARTTAELTRQPFDCFVVHIPWVVFTNQSVLVTTTFLCPLDLVSSRQLKFALPKSILPEDAATMTETSVWLDAFRVASTGRLPRSILCAAKGVLPWVLDAAPDVSQIKFNASSKLLADNHRYELKWEQRDPSLRLPSDVPFFLNLKSDSEALSIQCVKEENTDCDSADRLACCVSMVPTFPPATPPNIELVVAVDCSGSMMDHLAAVKKACKVLIRGLPASCCVNVLRFGSTTEWLHPEGSQQVSAASLESFENYINGMNADLRDTKLFSAMKAIYATPTITGFARVVLLLTDGQESRHSQSLLSLCHANSHTTSIVAVGLGTSYDANLLRMMATTTGGVFSSAADPSTQLVGCVVASVVGVLKPTLTHIGIQFKYDGTEEAPPVRCCSERLDLLPEGKRGVWYALGDEATRGFTTVVSALVGAERIEYRVHSGDLDHADRNKMDKKDVSTISLVHCAAAQQRVLSLVDRSTKSCLSSEEAKEVLRLGVAFSLCTPLTQCYCRTETAEVADADGKMMVVPYNPEVTRFVLPPPPIVKDTTGSAVDPDRVKSTALKKTASAHASTSVFMRGIVADVVDALCKPTTVEDVLTLQNADGSWSLGLRLAGMIGAPFDETKAAATENGSDGRFHMTTLVRKFLEEQYAKPPEATLCVLSLAKADAFLKASVTE